MRKDLRGGQAVKGGPTPAGSVRGRRQTSEYRTSEDGKASEKTIHRKFRGRANASLFAREYEVAK